MSSISDLQALVVAQGTLLTAVLAELAALKESTTGSPSTTVLSTADQASVDSMVEALTSQNAELSSAESPAPAPVAAPAGAASFMSGESVSSEPEEEPSSEAPESTEEPVA